MLEKNGLVKLTEECGELIQIVSKKMTRMNTDEHWDAAGPLGSRMENEIADVFAAARIVIKKFGLDSGKIKRRAEEKLKLFEQWSQEDE